MFINDFTAAGYGITRINPENCQVLGGCKDVKLKEGAKSVKVVIGPGTGLGEGILKKDKEVGLFHPFPSEGGHCDFAAKTDEDWELVKFARKFIETSNNVEN